MGWNEDLMNEGTNYEEGGEDSYLDALYEERYEYMADEDPDNFEDNDEEEDDPAEEKYWAELDRNQYDMY